MAAMAINRRKFLFGGTAALAVLGGFSAKAQSSSQFDLLIKGGEVIDPGQALRARRDVGIRNGVVAAIDADIAADSAARVLDAAGMIVTPGLVDLHTHVYPYGSPIGIPADELAPLTCTTTAVSAGDAGANTIAALKRLVASQARTRIYAFTHIANFGLAGFPVGEMLNIDHAVVEDCANAVATNPDFCLGVKVRVSKSVVGDNGLEPLRRAIAAAELAGPWAKVMCHIGDAPGDLSELLDLLRPGDVLTHSYSGAGNNIVQNGKLLPAVHAARERGVTIDVGHGGGSFDYTVAEPALAQGLFPDVISSDIHVYSGNSPGRPYLPWVMSKFLNLGMSLEQVIAAATINPARVIDREPGLGTLRPGAPADVAVMRLVEGPVTFEDTRENRREGTRYLEPEATVRAGVPFGRPYMAPFSRG
jgi:dihydroorotase